MEIEERKRYIETEGEVEVGRKALLSTDGLLIDKGGLRLVSMHRDGNYHTARIKSSQMPISIPSTRRNAEMLGDGKCKDLLYRDHREKRALNGKRKAGPC